MLERDSMIVYTKCEKREMSEIRHFYRGSGSVKAWRFA